MSEAMKPTPGPWVVERYAGDEWYFGRTGEFTVEAPDGETVAVIGCSGRAESDFRLIAEAGTVFHETGLSPRQLVEQRDELLAALRPMLVNFECQHALLLEIGNPQFVAWRDAARAAIAKCEAKQ